MKQMRPITVLWLLANVALIISFAFQWMDSNRRLAKLEALSAEIEKQKTILDDLTEQLEAKKQSGR